MEDIIKIILGFSIGAITTVIIIDKSHYNDIKALEKEKLRLEIRIYEDSLK